MKSLYQFLEEAQMNKTAVGHFNISDIAAFNAIIAAAKELNVPVMIGVSEGEREFVGVHQVAAWVRSVREDLGLPVFLNADHTHSLEKVKEAAEAGFDEILFDGSKLPLEENIKQTKQAVDLVKSINPEVLVEGEVGYIGSSSEIVAEVPPESLKLTTPEEAKQFVEATGVDILAPAVGNMHGMLEQMASGALHKKLDIARIGEIKKVIMDCHPRESGDPEEEDVDSRLRGNDRNAFLTLHGGSGTADEDFIAAIQAGITIIHINTELRLAWRRGVEKGLADNPQEIAPYKILPSAVLGIKEVVLRRLKLFAKTQ